MFIWEFACPRTMKKHRAFSLSASSSKDVTMVLDAACKETSLSLHQKQVLRLPPLQASAEDRGCTVLIVIMPLFSFSTFFSCLPSSFLAPFHPAHNKMEVKIDFLCELWY